MVEKEEVAATASQVTNKAIEELAKGGLDPDAVVKVKQRDLAHIASLATSFTLLGVKEQLEESQDVIKEYVLNEVSSELKDIDKLEEKMTRMSQRLDLAFKILDEHYEILKKLTEDV
jgi:vacuolar-type H+-ATPase subunit E/Vma4